MVLPRVDTVVTYPAGALVSAGTVLHVEPLGDGRAAVLLDRTACHPVAAAWPDQGADRATLTVGAGDAAGGGGGVGVGVGGGGGGGGGAALTLPVLDCVVGATDGTALHLGDAIPVRPGTDGWAFVVAHIVASPPGIESSEMVGMTDAIPTISEDSLAAPAAAAGDALAEGAGARIEVDTEHRRALSAGHTACHLASLALDEALAGAWTKEVALDARGHPAFDRLAIESSTIAPDGSLDVYRVGKSLRKKGFQPTALTDAGALDALAAAVDARLAEWCASGAGVAVLNDGDEHLGARRTWTCRLPEGTVGIPCGGTHVESLAAYAGIGVAFDLDEQPGALELRMRTTATPATAR